jgi:hypothetical protein
LGRHLWCSRSFASLWEAVGKPCLLLSVVFALTIALGSYWEAVFDAVQCSPSLASPWESVGKPLLLVFVVFAHICTFMGSLWEAGFASMCNVRAHLFRLGKPLGSHCCCYLKCSHSFTSPCNARGKTLLLLFFVFALTCLALESIGKTCVLLFAVCLHHLGKSLRYNC